MPIWTPESSEEFTNLCWSLDGYRPSAEQWAFHNCPASIRLVAGGIQASITGDGYQAFKHYGVFTRVRPVPWVQTVLHTEAGNNTQFKLRPIGALERNYISLGPSGFQGNMVALPDINRYTIAMLWE